MRTPTGRAGRAGSMCRIACRRETSLPVRQTAEASSRPIVSSRLRSPRSATGALDRGNSQTNAASWESTLAAEAASVTVVFPRPSSLVSRSIDNTAGPPGGERARSARPAAPGSAGASAFRRPAARSGGAAEGERPLDVDRAAARAGERPAAHRRLHAVHEVEVDLRRGHHLRRAGLARRLDGPAQQQLVGDHLGRARPVLARATSTLQFSSVSKLACDLLRSAAPDRWSPPAAGVAARRRCRPPPA